MHKFLRNLLTSLKLDEIVEPERELIVFEQKKK